MHCLRHSVARLLDGKRLHFDATAIWLGDDPKAEMGTIATYLRSPFTDLWSLRTRIASRRSAR